MDRFTLNCTTCGYDLRGQAGEVRVCPECGTTNRVADCARVRPRPLPRAWCMAAGAAALLGVGLIGGFHLSLASKSLKAIDLWNYGTPLTGLPIPGAAPAAALGQQVAGFCFYIALLMLPYDLILAGVALFRRDKLTALIGAASAIATVAFGLAAMRLGLMIAGI